jgi:hypothetical protein
VDSETLGTLTQARILKEQANARLAVHELNLQLGQVIRKDLAAEVLQRLAANASTRLNGLGTRLAAQLVGMSAPEIKDAIDRAVTEALTELNEFSFTDERKQAPPPKGRRGPRRPRRTVAAVHGPAKADGKRVG